MIRNQLARVVVCLVAFAAVWATSTTESAAATTQTQHHVRQIHRGWQCAPYARLITPILLRGNAWTWWKKADGQYARGNEPKIGAVMVFKRTKQMPLGHVAVVRRVINDREVWIEHANWARQGTRAAGRVTAGDRMVDLSKNNDWSDVRIVHNGNNSGRANPTYGFIYAPKVDPRTGIEWQSAEDAPGTSDNDDGNNG